MPEKNSRIAQHELYTQYAPLWQFYIDAYQGTGEFSDGSALVQFTREGADTYQQRKRLAYYPNYCAPIIDFYVSSVFRRGVQRDFAASKVLLFEDFVPNVDRAFSHIDDFMRTAALYAQIFGFCPVLVDMPREPELPILSKLDQFTAKMMPYFVILSPLQVWNWETDSLGALNWILICEERQEEEGAERFRFIDRERWEIIERREGIEYVIESQEHGLGLVPVVSVKNQPLYGEPFIGLSAIRDIARVNKRLMNLYSELDQILRNQTFSILTVPYDPEGIDKDGALNLGTVNALRFNPESSHAPQFISPDASQGQLYLEAIKRLIDEIFRLARLEQLGISREMSGVAMSYYFRATNDTLAAKADQLEKAESALWRIWCLWQGAEWQGIVHYPDEFDVRDTQKMIAQALDLQALGMGSVTFERILRKQIANAVLESVSDSDMQKVLEEINAASFEGEPAPGEAAFATAGV
jgi:hypothetical protein